MYPIVTSQAADSGTVRGLITALRGRYGFLDAVPIGQTVLGRDIMGLVLGGGRERILYTAGFYGPEWMTSLLLLRLCEEICNALQRGGTLADINIHEVMAGRSLVVVPQINPDGTDIAIYGSGAAGKYAPAVRRMSGNRSRVWRGNARGVDINRNFDVDWQESPDTQIGEGEDMLSLPSQRGQAPESEPETAALAGLCRRASFRHMLALHSQGNEIRWGYGEDVSPRAGMMAEVMAAAAKYTSVCETNGEESCEFKDWFTKETGRPGFVLSTGQRNTPSPFGDFEALYASIQEMLLLAALM